LEYKFEL